MGAIELLDAGTWEDFTLSPCAVMLVGKQNCPSCIDWAKVLETNISKDPAFDGIRFGKVLLDRGGMSEFKMKNTWLYDLEVLPFTAIYESGSLKDFFSQHSVEYLKDSLGKRN